MAGVNTVRAWKGLNRRVSDTDLDPMEAQDCKNCFHYRDTIGLLGPRRGKSFVNTTPLPSTLTGTVKWKLPEVTERIITTNTGDATQQTNASATMVTNFLTGDTLSPKTVTASTLTLTNPTTTVSGSHTFTDASTIDAENSLFVGWAFWVTLTFAGAVSGSKTLRLKFGLIEDSVAVLLNTRDVTQDWSQIGSFSQMATCEKHGLIGNITGAAFEISWPGGWPTGAGVGDTVVLGSFQVG